MCLKLLFLKFGMNPWDCLAPWARELRKQKYRKAKNEVYRVNEYPKLSTACEKKSSDSDRRCNDIRTGKSVDKRELKYKEKSNNLSELFSSPDQIRVVTSQDRKKKGHRPPHPSLKHPCSPETNNTCYDGAAREPRSIIRDAQSNFGIPNADKSDGHTPMRTEDCVSRSKDKPGDATLHEPNEWSKQQLRSEEDRATVIADAGSNSRVLNGSHINDNSSLMAVDYARGSKYKLGDATSDETNGRNNGELPTDQNGIIIMRKVQSHLHQGNLLQNCSSFENLQMTTISTGSAANALFAGLITNPNMLPGVKDDVIITQLPHSQLLPPNICQSKDATSSVIVDSGTSIANTPGVGATEDLVFETSDNTMSNADLSRTKASKSSDLVKKPLEIPLDTPRSLPHCSAVTITERDVTPLALSYSLSEIPLSPSLSSTVPPDSDYLSPTFVATEQLGTRRERGQGPKKKRVRTARKVVNFHPYVKQAYLIPNTAHAHPLLFHRSIYG